MRTPSFDLALEASLLRGQIIVVLDQLFEIAAPLLRRVVDFVHPVHPQQISELESVNTIALLRVIGDPGVGPRVRDDDALDQWRDH